MQPLLFDMTFAHFRPQNCCFEGHLAPVKSSKSDGFYQSNSLSPLFKAKCVQSCVGVNLALHTAPILITFGTPTSTQPTFRNQRFVCPHFRLICVIIWALFGHQNAPLKPSQAPRGPLWAPWCPLWASSGYPRGPKRALGLDFD